MVLSLPGTGGKAKKGKKKAKPTLKAAIKKRLLESLDPECSICLDVVVRSDTAITQCGHMYCNQCIRDFISSQPTGQVSNIFVHGSMLARSYRYCIF